MDLYVLPVHRKDGQDIAGLVGLYAGDHFRRAARSRGDDHLIFLLTLVGNASLLKEPQDQLLNDLATVYYKTSGSVTAALRNVAETLNGQLLDLNLKNPGAGQPVVGFLSQIVNRSGQLYLAQSGPVHAFFITRGEVYHIHAPDLSGRGLGLAKTAPIRYDHTQLDPNDTLLISDKQYPNWEKDVLAGLYGQGPESMRRRVLSRNVRDMRAVLIQAKQGKGKVYLLALQAAPQPTGDDKQESTAPLPSSEPDTDLAIAAAQQEVQTPTKQPADALAAAAVTSAVISEPKSSQEMSESTISGAAAHAGQAAAAAGVAVSTAPIDGDQAESEQQPAGSNKHPIGNIFGFLFRPLIFILQGLSTLLERILPQETIASIPNKTMALIALIVPIVVVSVSVVVYIRRGVDTQSQVIYSQAMELAVKAQSETDLLEKRSAWQNLLDYLDTTETLYSFPEAQELRGVAQQSLDEIDVVKHPEFKPAISGGLGASVEVIRIVSVDDDLYLLDGNSGSVLHAEWTDQGYAINNTFQCGPGSPGVSKPLIDILPWPVGFDPMASIVALDPDGTIVYCQPNQEPKTEKLTQPVSSDLTDLAGFVMDESNLYILDPSANAVWIYWNSEVADQPTYFFGDQVPPLGDVVDMMIVNNELYLLHADGHLTMCQYSSLVVAPTRCEEPVPYIDSRPARENTSLVPEYPFTQIIYNPPPDPSLFLLQPESQSIYHFSLRSPTFQTQYKPLKLWNEGDATAFTVDPNDRIFFLAVGNYVYYGRIP